MHCINDTQVKDRRTLIFKPTNIRHSYDGLTAHSMASVTPVQEWCEVRKVHPATVAASDRCEHVYQRFNEGPCTVPMIGRMNLDPYLAYMTCHVLKSSRLAFEIPGLSHISHGLCPVGFPLGHPRCNILCYENEKRIFRPVEYTVYPMTVTVGHMQETDSSIVDSAVAIYDARNCKNPLISVYSPPAVPQYLDFSPLGTEHKNRLLDRRIQPSTT